MTELAIHVQNIEIGQNQMNMTWNYRYTNIKVYYLNTF